MEYERENLEKLERLYSELDNCIGNIGAYSETATYIQAACADLQNAIQKYKEEIGLK